MNDKKIRCAIYTRKSTEEGLEQEFNSLQAQREQKIEQYVRRILELSFLLPKIVRSILNGTQPVDCTLKKLIWIDALDWPKQNKLFFDKFF